MKFVNNMEEMEIKKNNIYNIDCIDGMRLMDENSIDFIVTSPPYNVGKDYGEEYNDEVNLSVYLDFLRETFRQCYRILKNGGRIAINVANTGRKPYIPLSSYINIMMIELGFKCRGEIIWNKGASVGASCAWGSWRSPSNPALRDVHEYILIYSKGDYKHKGNKDDATISAEDFTEFTKSIWNINAASAKKIGHPAPFPLTLPERLINLYTFKGDTVLDPFMGSGTTAVACVQAERNYIGFEINKEFCDKAEERIKNETN